MALSGFAVSVADDSYGAQQKEWQLSQKRDLERLLDEGANAKILSTSL